MDTILIVVTIGSFLASFVNAAFATGGVYILLAASSSVLPLSAAVPLQSAFAFGSLIARIAYFRKFIHWRIVGVFLTGGIFGVIVGTKVFVSLPESVMSMTIGVVLIVLIWFPVSGWRFPFRYPFFPIGIVHAFLGTTFGVGAILQPAMLRTNLKKLEITGTLAACLVLLDVMKVTGYVSSGFRYQDFLPHIILATLAGFAGTWSGKRISHRISERLFRTAFKWLITAVAFRLVFKGLTL